MAIVLTDDKHYKAIANVLRESMGVEYDDFPLKPVQMSEQLKSTLISVRDNAHSAGYNEGFSDAYPFGIKTGKQEAYDTFWDTYQENGNRSIYTGAFAGTGWNKDTFKPKYSVVLSGSTAAERMFFYFNRISTSMDDDLLDFSRFNEMFDFSGCSSLNYTFSNARIKNLYCDCSGATTLPQTFSAGNGGYLENLTIRVTAKTTTFSGTFSYQKFIKNLTLTDDSEIAATISFSACENLTKASIRSIIDHLSIETSGITLTLSEKAVNKAFETSEGANDGSTSDEWNGALSFRDNWTISLV